MNSNELLTRALELDFLSVDEGVFLFNNASTADLSFVANENKMTKKRSIQRMLAGSLTGM